MQIRALLQNLHFSGPEKGQRSYLGFKILLIVSIALVLYSFYICADVPNPSLRFGRHHLIGGRRSPLPLHHKSGSGSHGLLMTRPGQQALNAHAGELQHQSSDKLLSPQEIKRFEPNRPELGSPPTQDDHHGCAGKFVYIYQLPPEFNEDLVDKCGRVSDNWVPLCGNLNNNGFGPRVPTKAESLKDTSIDFEPPHAWYRTEQFSLEFIFHDRLKSAYPCLTQDPELASAFYIPYYAAMDTAFTLFAPNMAARDRLAQRLVGWLSGNAVWMKFQGGKKHFMVLGRIAWDFSRDEASIDGWGSALLSQTEFSNVTKLLLEKRPWLSNEIAIPYPTSFHPSSLQDLELWQAKLRSQMTKRSQVLCSFIGSTSRGTEWSRALRAELAKQCDEVGTRTCKEYKCGNGASNTLDCARNPELVSTIFLTSTFCLQPSGDSPTRKGIFDSLLAGCIPVLFTNSSAYTQYMWHLPNNGSLYSLLFDGDEVLNGCVDIFSTLVKFANDTHRLHRMQEEIIQILPQIIYSSPGNHSNDLTFRDAFDVALENFLGGSSIPTS